MSDLGNSPGKNAKEKRLPYMLLYKTTYPSKYWKHSQKLRTGHLCTSDYDCAHLKRTAQYLVFVFLRQKQGSEWNKERTVKPESMRQFLKTNF